MTREDAKKLLPIFEAYANGKTIEVKDFYHTWRELADDTLWFKLDPSNYRIKQEPTYRPFKDAEECWNEMLKHQPFGWVKAVKNNKYYDIGCVVQDGDGGIWLAEEDYWTFDEAVNLLTFADGTPFGIKVL